MDPERNVQFNVRTWKVDQAEKNGLHVGIS
jgi:hypothetical protein